MIPGSAPASLLSEAPLDPTDPDPDPTVARRHHRWALVLALLQLLAGLAAGGCHEIGGYGVESDFYGQYAPGARDLLAGRPYTEVRSGPAYSAVLALAMLCDLDPFVAAKVLAAVSLALIGYLTFLTSRCFAPSAAALWSQALCYLAMFSYSFLAASDVPFLALVAASLWFALRRRSPTVLGLGLAGTFAGLAFITRYSGATLVVATLAGLLVWHPAVANWSRRLRDAGVYAAAVVLASSPWWIASLVWFGTPLHNKGYSLVAVEAYSPPDQRMSMSSVVEMDRRFDSIFEVIAHDPAAMAQHLTLGVYDKVKQMLADVVTLPAAMLLVPGLITLLLCSGDRRRLCTFLLQGALSCLLAVVVQYQARYYFPVLPAGMLLAGAALARRWVAADAGPRAVRWERRLRIGVAVVVASVLAAKSAIKTHEYATSEPLEVLGAVPVLRRHCAEDDGVVTRKAHLAFLAGARYVFPVPAPDREAFLKWLRRDSGARFLWVDAEALAGHGFLRPWQRGQEVPEGLRMLYRSSDPPAALYAIE